MPYNLDPEVIAGIGHQPALRFYDEASRNRDRFSLIVELNPMRRSASTSRCRPARTTTRAPTRRSSSACSTTTTPPTRSASTDAEREGELRRRLRAGDLQRPAGVAQRQPGPGSPVDGPEPQLDDDQRRDGEHFTVYVNLVKAHREDRHAFRLRLQRLRPGVRPRRAADCQPGDGAGQFIALPERDEHVAPGDLRPQLRAGLEDRPGLLLLLREVRRVRLGDHQHRRLADSLPVASLGAQTDTPRID